MTVVQDLMERAKQGDAAAIADLMNDALMSQEIRVKTVLQDGYLQVMFRASRPLNQHAAIAFTRRGILFLRPASITGVRLYAWQIDADFPDWISEFLLERSPQPCIKEQTCVEEPAQILTSFVTQQVKKTAEPTVAKADAIAFTHSPATIAIPEAASISSLNNHHSLNQSEAIASEPVLEQFSADTIQITLDEVHPLPVAQTSETYSYLKPQFQKKLTKVDSAVQFSVVLMFVVVFYLLMT